MLAVYCVFTWRFTKIENEAAAILVYHFGKHGVWSFFHFYKKLRLSLNTECFLIFLFSMVMTTIVYCISIVIGVESWVQVSYRGASQKKYAHKYQFVVHSEFVSSFAHQIYDFKMFWSLLPIALIRAAWWIRLLVFMTNTCVIAAVRA